MKRILHGSAILFLAAALAGCCYKPVTYDPITGVMYGGGLEPCCCGPLDPFCLFCNGCEQPLYPCLWPCNWLRCGWGGGCGHACGNGCVPNGCCDSGFGGFNCGPHTVVPPLQYECGGGEIIYNSGPSYPSAPVYNGPAVAPPSGPQPMQAPPEEGARGPQTELIVPDPVSPLSASSTTIVRPAIPPAPRQGGRFIPAAPPVKAF